MRLTATSPSTSLTGGRSAGGNGRNIRAVRSSPTRRSASFPQRIYDMTKQVAATATLVENGHGVTGAVNGIPFPIPENGQQAIWNHLVRYRADAVVADSKIKEQLKQWEEAGYGNLPVCMAKTQYSFTTDPNKRGAPTGFDIPVREVRLSAGVGFVVAICGEIMTMPGLPRKPAAETICLNDEGQIEGLF